MKIKRILINNYKSIYNQSLEGFTNVNMLYGHNNSGKSNILKFIDLIFKPKVIPSGTLVDTSSLKGIVDFPKNQVGPYWNGIIENQTFIFKNNDWNSPIIFEVDIEVPKTIFATIDMYYSALEETYFDKDIVTITIKGKISGLDHYTSEMRLQEVLLQNRSIYQKLPTEVYFASAPVPDNLGFKTNGYQILNSILNIFSDAVLFLDNDRYFGKEFENSKVDELDHMNFKNWFHNISLHPERYSEFLKVINEMAKFNPRGDENFNNNEANAPFQSLSFEFSRVKDEIKVLLTNGAKKRFPLENFGTGIQQVLYILSKISEKNPRLLLIEEMELNLSPKYQLELINHLLITMIEQPDSRLKQLFFTTHSPLLCYRSDFQIHNIIINEHGETKAIKLGKTRKEIADFYPDEIIKLIVEQRRSSK